MGIEIVTNCEDERTFKNEKCVEYSVEIEISSVIEGEKKERDVALSDLSEIVSGKLIKC